MLSTGAITVPSACLRCQLRQAISCTGKRVSSTRVNATWRTRRPFSASHRGCVDAAFDGTEANIESHEHNKLSEHPLGRIYGKPGRRHRETTARLSRDSLQKPFEVVLLRDVADTKEPGKETGNDVPHAARPSTIDASQIARDVLDQGRTATEAEISTSIDALQPRTTIVDDEEYTAIAKSLIDGYSVRQLSRYLSRSVQQPSRKHSSQPRVDTSTSRENNIPVLPWRPHHLPSNSTNSSLPMATKDETHHAKSELVDRVLRQCWSLSTVEAHQVGYLEMKMKTWQLSFLFDLYEDSKPMHEHWIKSPLLQRSSELRPDRADNVLRVIARKHDAEEIAEQIQQSFGQFESLKLNLAALKPLNSHQRRSKAHALPNAEALELIQRRLFCMFERRDSNTLIIHAPSEVTLLHARRAFLALCDLPSPSSVETIMLLGASDDVALTDESSNLHLLPEPLMSGVKTSDSNIQQERLISSTVLATYGSSGQSARSGEFGTNNDSLLELRAQEVNDRLLAITRSKSSVLAGLSDNAPFWKLGDMRRNYRWEVQFCRLLHGNIKSNQANNIMIPESRRRKDISAILDNDPRRSIVQSQIPGIANLLQHCVPVSDHVKSPLIVAHFVPNPFTTHGLLPLVKLPRIRMSYRLVLDSERFDVPIAKPYALRAVLNEHELRVQLPQEATDLRFVRQATLHEPGSLVFGDEEVRKFTAKLQHSLNRNRSFLDGKSVVKFRLPSTLFEGLTDRWVEDLREDNFELEYMFERFEHVQSLYLHFSPDQTSSKRPDPWLKEIMGDIPSDMLLRYREIEAGVIGGRRTELSLTYPGYSASFTENTDTVTIGDGSEDRGHQAETRKLHLQWVNASLRLASAITKINAG